MGSLALRGERQSQSADLLKSYGLEHGKMSWFRCVLFKGTEMFSGIVKNFDAEKGYGFIQPSDGSLAIFVHAKAVTGSGIETLVKGQKLTFEIEQDGKGRSFVGNLKLA